MTQPQTSRSRGDKRQPSAQEQAAAQSAHGADEAAAHRDQMARRLADLEAAEVAARAALDQAVADLGESAIGLDAANTTKAADLVGERQRDLQRAQAARQALERHLSGARERAAQSANDAKWDAYAAAFERRHAAFALAEAAARPFFEAVEAAIAAAREVWARTPAEKILTPDGWVLLSPQFEGMANMQNEELVVVRNALYDATKKSREQGNASLRAREFDKPGDAKVTQFDAPRAKVPVIEAPIVLES